MKTKRLRLKRWASSVIYISLVGIVFISMVFISNKLESNYGGTNLSYILKDFINSDIPVVSLKDSKIVKPYLSEKVTIDIDYYDIKGDETDQQKSLILYENTYMPNTGILYTSDEEFETIATIEGTVSKITNDELLGNVVEITHASNLITTYYSLKNVTVVEGQLVKQNDVIGTSGKNNISSTSDYMMLFEVSLNGTNIEPENYYNMKIEDLNN